MYEFRSVGMALFLAVLCCLCVDSKSAKAKEHHLVCNYESEMDKAIDAMESNEGPIEFEMVCVDED